jgi:hypothetical protein
MSTTLILIQVRYLPSPDLLSLHRANFDAYADKIPTFLLFQQEAPPPPPLDPCALGAGRRMGKSLWRHIYQMLAQNGQKPAE